jgi:hypothetical protein
MRNNYNSLSIYKKMVKIFNLNVRSLEKSSSLLSSALAKFQGSRFRVKQMKERFDYETNAEFIRFLRYARLFCTEVQTCPPSLSLRRGGWGETYVTLNIPNREL